MSISDVFSPSDIKHLPQAVLDIKTLGGRDYSSNGSSTPYLQFVIPASLGFFSAEQLTLNYDFTYTDTTSTGLGIAVKSVRKVSPQDNQGQGGLIHSIKIYSDQDGVLLETLDNYETLNAAYISHAVGADKFEQSGNAKKMSIIEGYVRDDDELSPYYSPNALPQSPLSLVGSTQRQYLTQKICLALRHSALLGGKQVVPVGALGGLRINIETQAAASFSCLREFDVKKRVKFSSAPANLRGMKITAGVNDTITGVIGAGAPFSATVDAGNYLTSADLFVAVQKAFLAVTLGLGRGTPTTGLAETDPAGGGGPFIYATTDTTAAPGDPITLSGTFISDFTGSATLAMDVAGTAVPMNGSTNIGSWGLFTAISLLNSEFGLCDPADLNTVPFVVGQALTCTDGAGNAFTTPVIKNISVDAGLGEILITFNGFFNPAGGNPAVGAGAFHSDASTLTNIEYTMTNVSLSVPVVTPPPSYVVAMQKAMASEAGLNMDIKTFALQRGSSFQGESRSTILIPTVQTKVKGVLSVPYVSQTGSFARFDLCNMVVDSNINKYYWEYFNVKNPQQSIDITRLAVRGKISQELLWESDKSFASCFDEAIETFQAYDDAYASKTWFLGRALSQFNGYMVGRDANLQLVVEATSSAGTIGVNLSWDNHLACMHTLNIKNDGVVLLQ